MCTLQRPEWMSVWRPRLMATISAQPISQPFDFQPGSRHHASHQSSTKKLIPNKVEASTKTTRGRGSRMGSSCLAQSSTLSCKVHQVMSWRMEAGILWVSEGEEEELKVASRQWNEGRWAWPSYRTRQQCCKQSIMPSQSLYVIEWPGSQEVRCERYLVHLLREIMTSFAVRSHWRPK